MFIDYRAPVNYSIDSSATVQFLHENVKIPKAYKSLFNVKKRDNHNTIVSVHLFFNEYLKKKTVPSLVPSKVTPSTVIAIANQLIAPTVFARARRKNTQRVKSGKKKGGNNKKRKKKASLRSGSRGRVDKGAGLESREARRRGSFYDVIKITA